VRIVGVQERHDAATQDYSGDPCRVDALPDEMDKAARHGAGLAGTRPRQVTPAAETPTQLIRLGQ